MRGQNQPVWEQGRLLCFEGLSWSSRCCPLDWEATCR
jgi:hypothetical protein